MQGTFSWFLSCSGSLPIAAGAQLPLLATVHRWGLDACAVAARGAGAGDVPGRHFDKIQKFQKYGVA